ncbi:MAG: HAMP domain-containing histidine kinase [Candidatus Nomurabacteria bacterium]|nr:HAMP domain-containing histidine kinase [Candidatus Saccharibacteria bacterium]USN95559.1 MAG: HAMP domain-containing histidine kinase [Candidatus Nomurabacteria bacterium]
MVISIFFSINIYLLATRELDRGYGRNSQLIINAPNDLPNWLKRQLLESSKSIIDEARAKVFIALLITNVGVLVVGGWISYILARRSLEPIEEAHASLERFTADASHELRTPISAMKSEIEVALMESKISDKDARKLLQSNLEELDVLTKLSDNLLTIARLGDQHLVLKKQNIQDIAQESIDRVLSLAEKKHILIKNQTDSKICASVNHASLVEVLVILLDNAIKYSPEKTTITVGTNKKDRNPEIFVEDQGSGIAKTDIPYIFNRFYQADTARSTQNRSGHGLGLSIAKQMTEKMNGSIKVASKWGKGSKFTILLNP